MNEEKSQPRLSDTQRVTLRAMWEAIRLDDPAEGRRQVRQILQLTVAPLKDTDSPERH
jgi:hypothetical protein